MPKRHYTPLALLLLCLFFLIAWPVNLTHAETDTDPAPSPPKVSSDKKTSGALPSPDVTETTQPPSSETDQEAGDADEPQKAEAPIRNVNDQTFEDWLERYRAWDKLDSVYAGQEDTPKALLRRVENLLQAGQPQKALNLVEQTPPLEDNFLEIKRLWNGGRALRAIGAPDQAVMWFGQAAALAPTELRSKLFKSEQGLETIWIDVFRNLFWTYISTYSVNREAQKTFLQQVITQAQDVWPKNDFWRTADTIFGKVTHSGTDQSTPNGKTFYLNSETRLAIIQCLAGMAVGAPKAEYALERIPNQAVREFWRDISLALTGQKPSPPLDLYEKGRYVKAMSFTQGAYFKQLSNNRAHWICSTEDFRLRAFMGNLFVLPPGRAHELFQQDEVDKLLPDGLPLNGIHMVRLASAFMAGDIKAARTVWENLQPEQLPLALRLCGMVAFHLPPSEVVTGSLSIQAPTNRLLSILAAAAGNAPQQAYEAPFWVKVEADRVQQTMLRQWPLDKELVLAAWREQWNAAPEDSLARRIAYLFPDHALGMRCMLFLAAEAVEAKQIELAAYYLNSVPEKPDQPQLMAQRLEVLADLEVARDKMPEAYAAYQELLATGQPVSDVTRLKIAFLMQQMGDLPGGKENLLRLWEKRDQFDTAMQAEILFYLAEGEAAMGNKSLALDHYLKLAWQYPQESMWALTAMYRAANIYEERREYEPAARLLRTVVKNAQTTKQRDAANARLESIKGKMGKPMGDGPGSLPYPF